MNQNYQVINQFDREQFNLLVATESLQEKDPNSIYKIVINQVSISTDVSDNEIYKESNAIKVSGKDMYALTHRALMKLCTAANGQIVESKKVKTKVCEKCFEIVKATQQAPQCGSCPCSANVAFQVTMKFPELSGGWRVVQASKEYDFGVIKGKDGQIAKMKEHAAEQVESKAISRAIRKALNIKSAYTLDELAKPFVVAYPTLDSKDPDVKKALIAGAVASSNLLYGTGLQIQAPQQQALSERVDTSTGEIYEADYDVERVNYTQETYCCSNPQCQVFIPDHIAQYSLQLFNQPLCNKCQQLMTGGQQV